MDSKKRLSWELIILAIVLVVAGFFVYLQQKNISVTELWNGVASKIHPVNQQMIDIDKEKRLTEENTKNFIRSNSLDNLFGSQQYQDLRGIEVDIDIDSGVGNPEPFNRPKIEVQP